MAQLASRLILISLSWLVFTAITFRATATEQGLTMLDDLPVANQIPLLDNRFRIDDGIKSITMVLFRRPGTSSIILVRPDGSKVFYNTAKQNNMRWFDAATYDFIEIIDPMPGPWQAIGRLLPESKILVLTDIALDVDPLPAPMMEGETFKLTARLKDGDNIVNAQEFKEILTLQVLFVSTNNKEHENYGRGIVDVATFRDDGRGFDASARDGIFTGEIHLNFGAGEWIPKFVIKTPLYTRELEQEPVVIKPAPVKFDITTATAEQASHQLTFVVDESQVDKASLLLQGLVRYPDGMMETFSLTEPDVPREVAMENRGPGSYIVDVSVFGQMLDGREFMLALPEARFLVTLQAQEAPEIAIIPELATEELEVETISSTVSVPWFWIVFINLLILTLGAVALWMVYSGRTFSFSFLFFWKKKSPVEPVSSQEQKATAQGSKVQKNNDPDDILDLSLPDD